MSKATGCRIVCQCGGHVSILPEDGVYYALTSDGTIIMRGKCGSCFEGVRVETPVRELLAHCQMLALDAQGRMAN